MLSPEDMPPTPFGAVVAIGSKLKPFASASNLGWAVIALISRSEDVYLTIR